MTADSLSSGSVAFPVEGAFSPSVGIGDAENDDEAEGEAEDGGAVGGDVVFVDGGPGIEEDDFDVEEDEEHGDDVEFDAEAGLGVAEGEHAALVSAVFHGVAAGGFASKSGEDQGGDGETGCDDDLEEDGGVVFQHEGRGRTAFGRLAGSGAASTAGMVPDGENRNPCS